jgi:hypothetical protein
VTAGGRPVTGRPGVDGLLPAGADCVSAPEVVASTFGDESVVLGGVRLALDHVEREVLGL